MTLVTLVIVCIFELTVVKIVKIVTHVVLIKKVMKINLITNEIVEQLPRIDVNEDILLQTVSRWVSVVILVYLEIHIA